MSAPRDLTDLMARDYFAQDACHLLWKQLIYDICCRFGEMKLGFLGFSESEKLV